MVSRSGLGRPAERAPTRLAPTRPTAPPAPPRTTAITTANERTVWPRWPRGLRPGSPAWRLARTARALGESRTRSPEPPPRRRGGLVMRAAGQAAGLHLGSHPSKVLDLTNAPAVARWPQPVQHGDQV